MAKNSIVAAFDSLPFILKIILALPVIDGFAWGIYRIAKGHVIAGILWIIFGAVIMWVADLICLVLYKKVTIFA